MFKSKFVLKSLSILFSALVAFGIIFFMTKDDNQASAANELYTVHPTPYNEYFTNPGMGWQDAAEQDLTQLLPDSTIYVPRHMVSWRVLNPGNGVYDWSILDAYLLEAIAQQKQLSFRVYSMRGESYGGHQVPQWVLNNGAKILGDGSPDYSNCTYQSEWGNFVNALRNRYDGVDQIAFIDVSGYGNFNEWSWTDGQTEWENNPNNPVTLDGQARDRLAAIFLGGSDNSHQCRNANNQTQTVSYNYTGFTQTQMLMPYAGLRQTTARVASLYPNAGIRHDCLGRIGTGLGSDTIMSRIGTQINATWRNAPIVYEFCGGVSGSETYMREAEVLLPASHASMVNDTLQNPRNASRINELMMLVGYRYQLEEATYSSMLPAGNTFTIEMNWRNIGYAPAYARMGQEFTLHIYLVNGQGQVVVDEIVPSNINEWMPAHPLPGTAPENIVSRDFTMPNIATGTYSLRVAIIENRTNNPINLAITGRENDGSYYLGSVIIQSGSGSPNTPVPSNTPLPPTATITNTPLPLPTMTNTPLPLPTMTNTPVPPPATNTPMTIPTAIPPLPTNPPSNPPVNPTNPPNNPNNPPAPTFPPPGTTPIPPTQRPPQQQPTQQPQQPPQQQPTQQPQQPPNNNNNIPANAIFIADLEGWSDGGGRSWNAYMRITVHNANGQPIPGVDIRGTWDIDGWNEWCQTDWSGSCVISRRRLSRNQNNVTFNIVRAKNWNDGNSEYMPQYNRDTDGDSNGSTMRVNR